MAYPETAIEYVVVHELAHIRHHDHSPAFYREVEAYLPDWRRAAPSFAGNSAILRRTFDTSPPPVQSGGGFLVIFTRKPPPFLCVSAKNAAKQLTIAANTDRITMLNGNVTGNVFAFL